MAPKIAHCDHIGCDVVLCRWKNHLVYTCRVRKYVIHREDQTSVSRCKECDAERAREIRNQDVVKLHNWKRCGIVDFTIENYRELFIKQEGKCATCKTHRDDLKEDLSADHNHKTGKIRKLLCRRCNRVLGLVDDDVELLEEMIQYLSDNQ